jgi:hypothetical protein
VNLFQITPLLVRFGRIGVEPADNRNEYLSSALDARSSA